VQYQNSIRSSKHRRTRVSVKLEGHKYPLKLYKYDGHIYCSKYDFNKVFFNWDKVIWEKEYETIEVYTNRSF
jgi:hypothetical protein